MPGIDDEMDEEMYEETKVLRRRQLTDQVLRAPLKHLPPKEAVCVAPETLLQACVESMRDRGIGCVLVCGEKNKELAGIFTERDLLLRVAGRGWNFHERRVEEVMTRKPECLTPQDTIGFALNMMMTKGYRHIPIRSEKHEPLGIVSVRDLLVYLCEFFPEDVINLPPEPRKPSTRDGG